MLTQRTNDLPTCSGVYFIQSKTGSHTYYVGQGVNIRNRLREHPVVKFLNSKNIEFTITWLQVEKDSLDSVEYSWIRDKRPTLNTVYNLDVNNSLKNEYASRTKRLASQPVLTNHSRVISRLCVLEERHKDAVTIAAKVGSYLVACREMLQGATKNNPYVSDIGSFGSFKEFYESQGFSKRNAYRYIKLAEHWDIVVKLGMQDSTNPHNLKHCMRLVRTVHVIDWYLAKLEAGAAEETLSMALYWAENEPHNNGPTKRQLIEQVNTLEQQLSTYVSQLMEQSSQLAALREELNRAKLENLKLRNKALGVNVGEPVQV